MTRDSHKIKQGENYCHGNCVNLVWMLYLGMRGTSVLNIDCYWLSERVCVNCPLVRAVTDTRHLSVSWMMCWLQLDTWAQDAVWCGPLVTELPALKSLKRIPELWIIITSNTPTYKLIILWPPSTHATKWRPQLNLRRCKQSTLVVKFVSIMATNIRIWEMTRLLTYCIYIVKTQSTRIHRETAFGSCKSKVSHRKNSGWAIFALFGLWRPTLQSSVSCLRKTEN